MIQKGLQQCYGILLKNLLNHWSNKKKLLGEFLFPAFISGLYILMQSNFCLTSLRPKIIQPLHLYHPRRTAQTVAINDMPVSNKVARDDVFERTVEKVQTVPNDFRTGFQGAYSQQSLLHGPVHVFLFAPLLPHAELLQDRLEVHRGVRRLCDINHVLRNDDECLFHRPKTCHRVHIDSFQFVWILSTDVFWRNCPVKRRDYLLSHRLLSHVLSELELCHRHYVWHSLGIAVLNFDCEGLLDCVLCNGVSTPVERNVSLLL